jgi:O-antigen/teichoic acid export membrane protein
MAFATGGQVLMQLVVLALLARFLTPAEFGLAGVGVLIVQFGQLLAESTIGPALIQRKELSKDHVRVALTFSALSALILWGLLALAAPWIAQFFRVPEAVPLLRAIGVVFAIRNVTVSDFLMAREMRFRELGIIELVG